MNHAAPVGVIPVGLFLTALTIMFMIQLTVKAMLWLGSKIL